MKKHNQTNGTPADLSGVSLIQIEDELQRRGLGFMFVNGKGIVRESGMTTGALILEVFRRQRAGECVALIITPEDIAEYCESDESGGTNPGSRVPEPEEMHAIRKAFERWKDSGAGSEVMEICRQAWDEAI